MNFKPILFSTEMVQAILDGRKTQTRRIVKARKGESLKYELWEDEIRKPNIEPIIYSGGGAYSLIDNTHLCPYGEPGDVLWVRESWAYTGIYYIYKANGDKFWLDENYEESVQKIKWRPSIHMPKEASRVFLKVKSIRVERLQDITEEDAIAEGVLTLGIWESDNHRYWQNYLEAGKDDQDVCISAKESFKTLWQSINGPDSWEANPWVWVIKFKRIEKPENFK